MLKRLLLVALLFPLISLGVKMDIVETSRGVKRVIRTNGEIELYDEHRDITCIEGTNGEVTCSIPRADGTGQKDIIHGDEAKKILYKIARPFIFPYNSVLSD